ncbi:ferritin-like domain-containing protein [Flavobacterium sp. DG1-102-2]|uniref:ferritin-like domain-containing protein n=1 Tax=Flavobacterium sp. DG1-102-2 TaxID=3081663 RepID=UPI0029490A9B|nr:ferritin-like domain-containing protein [Flavobacterium sp. DG1-102-2]MDV6170321.1 ferritin-like domain-containing protein [Flavobacterium sp. DG1-102-2]
MKKVQVEEVKSLHSRRNFLRISGITLAGAGLVMAGCSSDDDNNGGTKDDQKPGVRNGVFDLGGGDLGVLTYAYALEQLEADFYTRVVNSNTFGSTFNSEEQAVLTDLYRHEVIHREFFKAAISGVITSQDQLLPALEFDYGSLSFSSRAQVLATAKTLEDTGVAAYNGAGRYITTPDYLVLAGKIVSVEARHAAAIRSLINPGSADFAGDDVVDPTTGLGQALKPSQIITAVSALDVIQTKFTAQFLP